jgi:hypothetical protein
VKKWLKNSAMLFLLATTFPTQARADFWGLDIPILTLIEANTAQQLVNVISLLKNATDTWDYIHELNEGLKAALTLPRTQNSTIVPGIFSQFPELQQIISEVEHIYGRIPKTSESKMQSVMDQSVAEAITLHNQAFQYAAQIDPEAERIKEYAGQTSPAGSARLTAQSLGVLIHVSNQILRTNAAMLKMMSENLALQNRKEKLSSEQYIMQYEGLSKALNETNSFSKASTLGQSPTP